MEAGNQVCLKDSREIFLEELEREIKSERESRAVLLALDASNTRDAMSDGYNKFVERLDLLPVINPDVSFPSRYEGRQLITHLENRCAQTRITVFEFIHKVLLWNVEAVATKLATCTLKNIGETSFELIAPVST